MYFPTWRVSVYICCPGPERALVTDQAERRKHFMAGHTFHSNARPVSPPSGSRESNSSGSSSSLPRHFGTPRLTSVLSDRMSLSLTREGHGSRLPCILGGPNPNRSTRGLLVGGGDAIPGYCGSLEGGPGKPSDGEGGHGFRCELVPNFHAHTGLI